MPAQQYEVPLARQLRRQRLAERTALRREIDDGRSLPADPRQCLEYGLRLEQHARAASIRAIVHRAATVQGEIARIGEGDLDQTALPRLAQYAVLQRP